MASRNMPTSSNSPRLDRREVSGTSTASAPNMVDQMKQYVDQVILICTTMLTFLQQQPQTADTSVETSSQEKRDEQVEFLKAKLRELVDVNVSWQHTHQLQERRIAELVLQIQQLTTSPAETQQATFVSQLEELNVKIQQLEIEKCSLENENRKLKKDVEDLKERCQLLDVQLVVNREDFENERKDRERGQQKANELLLELERCKQLLGATARQPVYLLEQPYDTRRSQRPFGTYAVDVFDGDEHDSELAVADSAASLSDSEQLQCPNCRRRFTKDQHEELMDHMDRCEDHQRTF